MSSFRIVTFGCKVNQCDSQILRETLISWGLSESGNHRADVTLVNTCTVTGGADAKCGKALRKIRRENPHGLIALTGCYAERVPRSAQTPAEADLVFSSKDPLPLARLLCRRSILKEEPDPHTRRQSYFAEHTRAFLKIQDGCDCSCSYCIVPVVRPTLWSEEPENVIAALNGLSANGYKEAVLTGIHLGFYGRDRGERGLASLLARIEADCAIERVRLSSLEVNEVSDEMLDLMARSSKICRHLHLPLQSGDNDVLQRMSRRYTADFFASRVADIRERIPDIGITTDIVVGFPGETEEQFQQTCDLVRNIGFARLHVFRYSRRPGTRAAHLPFPVPPNRAAERARRLIRIGDAAAIHFKERFVGRKLPVLVESCDKRAKFCQGLTSNYVRVWISNVEREMVNTIQSVVVTGVEKDTGRAIGVLA